MLDTPPPSGVGASGLMTLLPEMGYGYETETNMRFEYRESLKPSVRRAEEKMRRRRKPGKRSSTRPRTRFAGNGITNLEEHPRVTTRSLLRRQERMESLRKRLGSHKSFTYVIKRLVGWFLRVLLFFLEGFMGVMMLDKKHLLEFEEIRLHYRGIKKFTYLP